jgi:hypothetical protein
MAICEHEKFFFLATANWKNLGVKNSNVKRQKLSNELVNFVLFFGSCKLNKMLSILKKLPHC